MQRFLAAPIVALVLAVPALAAAGAPVTPCHDYKDIVEVLGRKYQEASLSLGVQTNGDVLQVFATNDKATWTVVSVQPSGRTCILAAGKHWEQRMSSPRPDDPEA